MSKETVEVHLGESELLVGRLSFHQQGRRQWSTFSYDDSWLNNPKSFFISPDLPLSRDWYTKKAESLDESTFHLAIQDTEPDGWARRVINRDFTKKRKDAIKNNTPFKQEALTELDYLLWVDDASRAGALRFSKNGGPFLRESSKTDRAIPPLLELSTILNATQAVEKNKESNTDLAYLQGKATSLGGMRPKCSILDDNNFLCIGKFPSITDERSVTKGEVLCLKLAALAGIQVAEAKIIHVVDTPVALIKRFDRTPRGKRIHYLSASSLMQADPKKDNNYVDLANTIRKHGSDPENDLPELWRRIIFNMLITNIDDHLHNQGFLYSGNNQWRLSPAFDINPFPDRQRELKTWLSAESGPHMSINEALQIISEFNLNKKQALDIIKTVVNALGKWKTLAASKSVQMSLNEIKDFELAFEHETLIEAKTALTNS
jgi:serine/threonine-protein kinase HipA